MFIDASFRVAAAQNYRAQNYRANKKGDLTAVAATTTYSSRDLLMGRECCFRSFLRWLVSSETPLYLPGEDSMTMIGV
jgi:hypothetical protein